MIFLKCGVPLKTLHYEKSRKIPFLLNLSFKCGTKRFSTCSRRKTSDLLVLYKNHKVYGIRVK